MGDDSPFIATVGYVRSQRIGHLIAYCQGKRAGGYWCHHQKTISIEAFADDVTLASIARALVCERCGAIGIAEVRPDWSELYTHHITETWGLLPPTSNPKTRKEPR